MARVSACRRMSALLFYLVTVAGAVELTPKNWDKKVAGKMVFIKFFAPWCGHCKKIKPDWDKLMKDFKGSSTALVAEVDCTGKGKPLCEQHGITGFPRLLWGKAEKLEVYNGERTYQKLKAFADDNLGPSCGPARLELCDDKQRALIEKFMGVPPEKLDAKVMAAQRQLKKAEEIFQNQQFNFTAQIDLAETKKNEEIQAIKDRHGMVSATVVPRAFELTPENWDERTKGKAVFIKFFAPWCGHCKKVKPDWDQLQARWEGTKSAIVAEVDCTGKGQPLCDKHDVTGYPRIMWAQAGESKLSLYTNARTFSDMKSWADMILGEPCGPNNLNACEKKYRSVHAKASKQTAEKRAAMEKAAEKEIQDAETRFRDVEWNMSLAIDKAEQDRDKRFKEITEQGLTEAMKVQKWNKLMGGGSWKAPASTSDTATNSFFEFVFEPVLQVGEFQVNFLMLLYVCAVLLLLAVVCGPRGDADQKSCTFRHILMEKQEDIMKAKERLEAGEDFGTVAAECSKCPSGKSSGGSLGLRIAGTMDPAIEEVCFDPSTELGKVVGPVESKFGFHLLLVDARTHVKEIAAKTDQPSADDNKESRKDR